MIIYLTPKFAALQIKNTHFHSHETCPHENGERESICKLFGIVGCRKSIKPPMNRGSKNAVFGAKSNG